MTTFKLTPAQQRWGFIGVGVAFVMGAVWLASSTVPAQNTANVGQRTSSLTGTNVVDLTIESLNNAQRDTSGEVAVLRSDVARLEAFLNQRLGMITETLGEATDLRNTALSEVERARQEQLDALRNQGAAMTEVIQDLANRITAFEQAASVGATPTGQASAGPPGPPPAPGQAPDGGDAIVPSRTVTNAGRVRQGMADGFTAEELYGGGVTSLRGRDAAATDTDANRQRARAADGQAAQVAGVRPVVSRREDPGTAGGRKDGPALTLATGSILRATLLNGALAPTSGTTRENPLPMLLRVDKEALMPNRFRSDIRECFLIISGYGELSSERIIARAERISCIAEDATMLEGQISGYAVAEDGQVGIPGVVVSKAGTVLAAAALAGFAEGVSEAFQVDIVPVINVDDGTGTSSDNVTRDRFRGLDSLQSAAAQGAGSALSRIADYYLELADQILPVVEVLPGRAIEIILTAPVDVGAPEDPAAQPATTEGDSRQIRSFRG